MDTFKEYMNNLNESRYKTHGVQHVKRTLPKLLWAFNLKFTLDINKETDDFQLYFYNNGNFDKNKLDIIISRCEIFGYFPSFFTIDKRNIFQEYKDYVKQKHEVENNKRYIDFIDYVRIIEFEGFKEIYLQFESYQDTDIDYVPDMLYHVCRNLDLEKIKRYGLTPRSKSKISYHPDRIYLTTDKKEAKEVLEEFKEINDEKCIIIKIIPDQELINVLKLKKDPNWENGYYTTHNIPPMYIEDF